MKLEFLALDAFGRIYVYYASGKALCYIAVSNWRIALYHDCYVFDEYIVWHARRI